MRVLRQSTVIALYKRNNNMQKEEIYHNGESVLDIIVPLRSY